MIAKLQRSKRKAMYDLLDIDAAMASIYEFDDAYIVADSYLVIYALVQPWFAAEGVSLLTELLVVRVAVSGADFTVVPAFLEGAAREAGCKLAVVGTALAKADNALASLYIRSGFKAETITLTKEP